LNVAVISSGSVNLSWTYGGRLAANEYFDVRIWTNGQPANGIANVKETSYAIGRNVPTGAYEWTVAVIRRNGDGTVITLATGDKTLTFSWVRPLLGPKTCPRGSTPICS